MERLAVLGGSTPFAAGLVDALAAADALPPRVLALHGRDAPALEAVAAYAAARLGPLGWRVEAAGDAERVVDGAAVVLQQIRFGGMEGRAQDERLALRFGLAADETLGPAALRSALRAAPSIRALGSFLARRAPDAWVINLTNPLSVTTSLLAGAGVRRCVGTCELAEHTAAAAAKLAGHAPREVRWEWVGLNHRAFAVGLRAEGEDLFERFLAAVGPNGFLGVPRGELERLGAIPTKYHALLSAGRCPSVPGRAAYLQRLRERVLAELRANPTVSPPSLAGREQPWYADAVLPLLRALSTPGGAEVTVTVADDDGVSRERRAVVSPDGVAPPPPPPISSAVREWLERFEAHERAVLAALRDPSPRTLADALAADPLVGPGRADAVADALWEEARQGRWATSCTQWS